MAIRFDPHAAAAFDLNDDFDLHDPRFGNAGSTEVTCPTCGMRGDVCMGHHASLSLGMTLFHPLLHKRAQEILNKLCFRCGKHLEKGKGKSRALRCKDCDIVNHGDYIIYADDLSRAVRQKNKAAATSAKSLSSVLPAGYTVSTILVPPVHLRTPEYMEWSTELQRLYEQLVIVVKARKNVSVQYSRITASIMGMMSGKQGVFRELMMGKRVNMSARAVIVGDPTLPLNVVSVPRIAMVRVNVTCAGFNIARVRNYAENEKLWWKDTDDVVAPENILLGMTFQREMEDGDLLMLNRQPSLSRQSLVCFRAKIVDTNSNVFAINPQATPPFNADFDGDEMNTFFMSQTMPEYCRAEMSELCSITNTIPTQDLVTGCYIMSKNNVPVSREVWDDCALLCEHFTRDLPQTTRGLLSMCIDGCSNDQRVLKKMDLRGADLYTLQLVVLRWLSTYGLTAEVNPIDIPILPNESPDTYRERCTTTVTEMLSGSGLMNMIESGAKGSTVHATHMAVALGQQYVGGKEGVFCTRSYSRGLTPDEFFGHQMAAREGVVSTGVQTAFTGYLNRRSCKIVADLKMQYNGTVADEQFVSSFGHIL